MRRAPVLLMLLLAPACTPAPTAGSQAGFVFTLAAVQGFEATPTPEPPATPTPAPVVDATRPPSPRPSPSPSDGGVIYSGGGGSGGGGAPPPPPPPGVAIAPVDGGFTDPAASETGTVGP